MLGELYPVEWMAKKLKNTKPCALTIVLNARTCNRSCSYCAIDNLSWPNSPIDIKAIEDAFRFAFDTGRNPAFLYVGGEPFHDKETLEAFFYICDKFKEELNLVEILSNMDYWEKYKDRINALPNRNIVIISTNRTRTFFESNEKVKIFNKIFLDEISFDFNYPIGPNYKYLFNLKIPTYWNNIGDEFMQSLDFKKIEEKIDWFHKQGCQVYIDSNITKSQKDEIVTRFYSDVNWYKELINFPLEWKAELVLKRDVCKACKKECVKAIPNDNGCPILHTECLNCEYLPLCSPLSEEKFGFNKNKVSSCEPLKWASRLAEKYRKIYNL